MWPFKSEPVDYWREIRKDPDSEQFTLRTASCGCCAESAYYPPYDFQVEEEGYQPLTVADVDELEKNLRKQLELTAELRAAIAKG